MSSQSDVATDQRAIRLGFLLLVMLLLLPACAGRPGSAGLPSPALEQRARPALLADASTAASSGTTANDRTPEEPYDPFATPGEGGVEEYDPWESMNVKLFEFNRQLDRWAIKPVAQGYNVVVPNVVQIGISNLFYHIRFPQRFLNNLFQGKVRGAGIEVGRFLINTGLGLAGFYDAATEMDITTPEEDTGQTFGYYGIKQGPYVIVPFLPPYTVRDLVGYGFDILLNPINWLVFPIFEIDAIPALVDNSTTVLFAQLGGRVGEIVNTRSLNLEKFQGVEESTLDLYTAVRNAYLQKRARAIQE
jgi:phospholipid-binding lipoprotein MlaA